LQGDVVPAAGFTVCQVQREPGVGIDPGLGLTWNAEELGVLDRPDRVQQLEEQALGVGQCRSLMGST